MGVVLITMPGDPKRVFANALHRKLAGGVDLVLVQKKPMAKSAKWHRASANHSFTSWLREAWYAFLLRISPRLRRTLSYFRESNTEGVEKIKYLPEFIEVDDINSDEVYKILSERAPDVLVVWGSRILSPRILGTAKQSINLHIGHCPEYRGTLANQCAVLHNDRTHIGATIHELSPKVDAGDIVATIEADLSLSPRDVFVDLHTRALEKLLDIVDRLVQGEVFETRPQDLSIGKHLKLKDWVPSIRYTIARHMRAWEREYDKNKTNVLSESQVVDTPMVE